MNNFICSTCKHVDYCMIWAQPCCGECQYCTHANEAQCNNDCASAMLFNDLNDDAIDNNVKE